MIRRKKGKKFEDSNHLEMILDGITEEPEAGQKPKKVPFWKRKKESQEEFKLYDDIEYIEEKDFDRDMYQNEQDVFEEEEIKQNFDRTLGEEEQIEEELRKNFKMKGLILADIKIIKMHDKHLESGTSKLVPATITMAGEVSEGKTNGVNKEEFKILQDYIYRTIKQISKEILSGNIALKPYNKNGKKPCEYCSYKAICGFDPRLCGNNYNYIDKKSKDDIIRKMSQC